MALSKERLNRWRDRRMARMSRLGLVRAGPGGGAPAYYVADELLVRDEHRLLARDAFARRGFAPDDIVEAPVAVCGFRRYRSRGLDVLAVAETISRRARDDGDSRPAAAANHVFRSAPFEHGGAPITTSAVTVLPENVGRSPADRVTVVVIDTGIWEDSPRPTDRSVATRTDNESDVDGHILERDVAHANFIVGVIAQHAPDAEVRVVRVLDTFGLCTEADLMTALCQLPGGASVVNLSLGGFTVDDQPPRPLAEALGGVLGRGDRLVVAASGNDGARGRPFWPAAFSSTHEPWAERVVAVAAHDGDELLPWSNTGSWVTVAAPGADIRSTYLHHPEFPTGWAVWSGTSFAAPYVVAAIVRQLRTVPTPLAALRAVLDDAPKRYGSHPGLG